MTDGKQTAGPEEALEIELRECLACLAKVMPTGLVSFFSRAAISRFNLYLQAPLANCALFSQHMFGMVKIVTLKCSYAQFLMSTTAVWTTSQ